MITLEDKLIQLNDYINWLYGHDGLQNWQLQTIALGVLCLLLLLLIKQRKAGPGRVRIVQGCDFPETIGPNLIHNRANTHASKSIKSASAKQVHKEIPQVSQQPQVADSQKSRWKHATDDWKTSTEKIKQLQREITKSKRNEDHLKFQISEMTKLNENLMRENVEYKKIENDLRQRIADLSYLNVQIQRNDKNQKALNQSVSPDIQVEEMMKNSNISNFDIPIPNLSDFEESDSNETDAQTGEVKHRGLPLDIQELEAIAEMARRLRQRSKDHQKENANS
jgi:hypothetical protein